MPWPKQTTVPTCLRARPGVRRGPCRTGLHPRGRDRPRFNGRPEGELGPGRRRGGEGGRPSIPETQAARVALGRVLIFRHAHERAIAEMEAALALNPGFDRGHYGLGMALLYGGRPEESIPQFESGIRLSPRSPLLWAYWMMLGLAYINLEKYEEATATSFEKAIQQPNAAFMVFVHAASPWPIWAGSTKPGPCLPKRKQGNLDSRSKPSEAAGQFGPHSGVARIIDGLRKAGLSE